MSKIQHIPLEPAIINADWTKNIMYPGYKPYNDKLKMSEKNYVTNPYT